MGSQSKYAQKKAKQAAQARKGQNNAPVQANGTEAKIEASVAKILTGVRCCAPTIVGYIDGSFETQSCLDDAVRVPGLDTVLALYGIEGGPFSARVARLTEDQILALGVCAKHAKNLPFTETYPLTGALGLWERFSRETEENQVMAELRALQMEVGVCRASAKQMSSYMMGRLGKGVDTSERNLIARREAELAAKAEQEAAAKAEQEWQVEVAKRILSFGQYIGRLDYARRLETKSKHVAPKDATRLLNEAKSVLAMAVSSRSEAVPATESDA